MTDDPGERQRVYDRIAPVILAFAHDKAGQQFHAEDLRRYVLDHTVEIAPGSPDRILRQLRLEGRLDYTVISRSQSLYQFHANGDPEMNVTVKPADLVEEYIRLRDEKQQAEKLFGEALAERCGNRMLEIEAQLLDTLNALGVDSLAGHSGTAYKKVSTSVTVADAREFRRHVIGTEQWDLANWSANKTLVNELVEKGEPVPPGLNRSAFYTIGIRRKTS